MWNLKTIRVGLRTNVNANCMTIFNYPERNFIDCLTHDNPKAYKSFPKKQVVGVWKIKKNIYESNRIR